MSLGTVVDKMYCLLSVLTLFCKTPEPLQIFHLGVQQFIKPGKGLAVLSKINMAFKQ
jgi:hypothetical protein